MEEFDPLRDDLVIGTCSDCGSNVHTQDMGGQVPTIAYLSTALVVKVSVMDMMMQLDEYVAARDGWDQLLDQMLGWLLDKHRDLDHFGEAYDEV